MRGVPSVAVSHVDVTAEFDELFNDITSVTTDSVLHGTQRRLTAQVAFQHLQQSTANKSVSK